METVTKKAWDPITEREYKIEIPAARIVKEALLVLDYSQGAIKVEEAAGILAEQFSLTDKQKNAEHENGFRIFNHHVGSAAGALVKKGQLVRQRIGWIIDPKQGNEGTTNTTGDSDISKNALPLFTGSESQVGQDKNSPLPEESIGKNYQKIREGLAEDLLQQIKVNSPTFFEELVIDLLVKMGYGGSREDAQAVGRSGDGGIDGIINEDRLGLDVIYVQAKRWENNVSEPPVRDFVGALQGKRARKGIFITTSGFTNRAREYISAIDSRDSKVILIDGNQLAQLMMEHDIGVSTTKTYEIKRVDSDYFAENAENA